MKWALYYMTDRQVSHCVGVVQALARMVWLRVMAIKDLRMIRWGVDHLALNKI